MCHDATAIARVLAPRDPQRPILTDEELERMRRETPRPRRRNEVTDEDLANTIERAWNSSRRPITVDAQLTLRKLRRGGAS
jgi:hypothetical protein